MIFISSCITGVKCRYNASHAYNSNIMHAAGKDFIHACPELLAGFPVPRNPCEITDGSGEDVLSGEARIIDSNGNDITTQMIAGAEIALQMCRVNGVTKAFLQAKSPSCGCGYIYDGSFSGILIPGNGVFAALLLKNGIKVIIKI